jgi:hypothetical protein
MEFVLGMIFAGILCSWLFSWVIKEMREDNDYWYENSTRWMNAYFEKDDECQP